MSPRPPSDGRVTEGYGMRYWTTPPRMHYGEDTIGYGNYAPVTGRVVFAGYFGGLGNLVGIREDSRPWVIWWVGHHAYISVSLGEQAIEGATFLGLIGTTGNSTGVHAHTERREDGAPSGNYGAPSDPRPFYTSSAGGGGVPFPNQPERKKTMTTLYHTTYGSVAISPAVQQIAAAQAFPINTGQIIYALCGDGPLPLLTHGSSLANAWAARHGNSIELAAGTFNEFVEGYWAQPASVELGDVTVEADNTDVVKAIEALASVVMAQPKPPTAAEIAAAYFVEAKKPGN